MKTALKLTLALAGLVFAAPAQAQPVVDQNGNTTETPAAANSNTSAVPARHRRRAVNPDNNSSVEASKSGGTVGALKDNDATGTVPPAHH